MMIWDLSPCNSPLGNQQRLPLVGYRTHDQASTPGLREHGDSQTVVIFPPKTPPCHFHHQKVLCGDANIYICIALKIINSTPVNRSLSLHQLWVSTAPKREAPSQHHDWGLCHLDAVETIMVGSNFTILDQIAKFFLLLLLSDAPSYWFTLNTSCDHAFHLSKRLGMDDSDYKALLIAGNLARYKFIWIAAL